MTGGLRPEERCANREVCQRFSTRRGLSSPRAKNIFVSFFRKLCFSTDIPPHRRGAYASSRYVEAGSGGRDRSARRARVNANAKSCGPGLPVLRPSLRIATSSQVTGARKPVPEEQLSFCGPVRAGVDCRIPLKWLAKSVFTRDQARIIRTRTAGFTELFRREPVAHDTITLDETSVAGQSMIASVRTTDLEELQARSSEPKFKLRVRPLRTATLTAAGDGREALRLKWPPRMDRPNPPPVLCYRMIGALSAVPTGSKPARSHHLTVDFATGRPPTSTAGLSNAAPPM
jgi:hypothetical protein